jgi:hypothetical protein
MYDLDDIAKCVCVFLPYHEPIKVVPAGPPCQYEICNCERISPPGSHAIHTARDNLIYSPLVTTMHMTHVTIPPLSMFIGVKLPRLMS